ncbi:MAG: toll/interleukin-1 receptor domain-containing protein [Chitinophagaceae bacterium]
MAVNRPKCFISYAQVDTDFVYENIIPILERLQIDIWVAGEQIKQGYSIQETIIDGIRQSDLVICFLNRRSTFVNFEIGAALGNNKPVLAIVNEYEFDIPSDFRYLNYLSYNENNLRGFPERLRNSIEIISETVIDKATFAYNPNTKIIGISVGSDSNDFAGQLSFTSAFIDFIKYITDEPVINLLQTSKGSLKSLVSLDLKSWAELVEKIIFFIPELKKRKQDRLKVEADIRKTDAETNQINVNTKIRQAEAFLDIAERYQRLGFTIQIDDDLLILQSPNGQLTFKQPPRIE